MTQKMSVWGYLNALRIQRQIEVFYVDEADLYHVQRGDCPICAQERVILNAKGEPIAAHVKSPQHQRAVKRMRAMVWEEDE